MTKFLAFFFMMMAAGTLRASPPILFDGINIEPVVTYYGGKVSRLKKDMAVYNWSGNASVLGSSNILEIMRGHARSYWKFFEMADSAQENYFGLGLYAAVDPVATSRYGGQGSNWLLTRMIFPQGFRVLNVSHLKLEEDQPREVADLLLRFNCSTNMGVNFARAGKRSLAVNCQKFIRELFTNHSKIDAFAYGYFAQPFSVCTKPGPALLTRSSVAFVILDGEWMNAERVQAFTANTVGLLEDRRLLQTLFIRGEDHSKSHARIIDRLLPRARSLDKASYCGDQQCDVYVYRDGWIQEASYKKPPGEELIQRGKTGRILWPDLVGQRQVEHVDEWLRQNIIGCDGIPPY